MTRFQSPLIRRDHVPRRPLLILPPQRQNGEIFFFGLDFNRLIGANQQSQQTPRGNKRPRSPPAGSPPIPRQTPTRRDSQSSLPPSSPPPPFSDTDDSMDERDAVRDVDDAEEDEEGEDLFAQNLEE